MPVDKIYRPISWRVLIVLRSSASLDISTKLPYFGCDFQGIPPECLPETMTYWQSVKYSMRWQFSWTKDPCLNYMETVNTGSLWKASPLVVNIEQSLTSTCTRMIFIKYFF